MQWIIAGDKQLRHSSKQCLKQQAKASPTLYDNLVISYLRPLTPWYGKRRGDHPYLYDSMAYGFAMCSSSTHLFIKYLSLEFSHVYLTIQISNFQNIPYFTMKHGNHGSCILSNLLEVSHNYAFLLQHQAYIYE